MEISTAVSQDVSPSEESVKEAEGDDVAKHDVKYFRDQMEKERNHMTELCSKWTEITEKTSDIPDDGWYHA